MSIHCPNLNELPPPPPERIGWPWTEQSEHVTPTMPDGSPWPKISIVTPSYNQAQFLEETIRSVLLQSYPNLEYIIIDGGSSDGSVDIIRKYEPWLTYWVSEPDNGQSDAINRGMRRATGQVIAWINSDDYYLPNILGERAAYLISRPNAVLVYGDLNYVDADGNQEALWKAVSGTLKDLLITGNHIPQQTVFMRGDAVRQIGYLNRELHYIMDYDLWVRLAMLGELHVLPGRVANFRRHSSSKTVSRKVEFALEHLQWLKEWPGLTDVLTEHEIAEARRHFCMRAATAYVKVENAQEAAKHFSLAFQDGVWPHGDLDYEARHVAYATGLNSPPTSRRQQRYRTLGNSLRKTRPRKMATQLWREIAAAFEMKQVFQYHGMGRTGSVRPHLLKGIWYRPRWLLNGGVWSIAADAFLGSGITGRVRALLGRLPLKRLYS